MPMTTPHATLTRFTANLLQNDPAQVTDCIAGTAGAESFQRLWENPANDAERNLQSALHSLIPPVQELETNSADGGVKIRWSARVRQPFTTVENGVTKRWQAGERFELQTVMKQVGDEWKIVGF